MSGRACVFTPGQRVIAKALPIAKKDVECVVFAVNADAAIIYIPQDNVTHLQATMTPLSNLVAPEPPKAVPGKAYRQKVSGHVAVGCDDGRLATHVGSSGIATAAFDPDAWEPVE